ncbi:MAG: TagF domain-containing protein [Acidobacteriota bacterium]|jgi:type VI secretion system ImpM family protein
MGVDYLELGCFGKVPCWEEHWQETLSDPSAHALRQWVSAGREETGTEEAGGVRFLFGLPESADLVVGILRPSRDKKSRSYPFAVLSLFPRRPYRKTYATLPLALVPTWEALSDAWESLAGVADRSSFQEMLESTLVPSPPEPRQTQADYEAMQSEPLGRMLAGPDGGPPRSLPGDLGGLVSRLKAAGAEGLVAEVPVSQDLAAAAFDVAFWIDMVNRRFRFKRHEPAVFIRETVGERGRTALLSFGRLLPRDYAAILGAEGSASDVERLAEGKANAARGGQDASYGEALKRGL